MENKINSSLLSHLKGMWWMLSLDLLQMCMVNIFRHTDSLVLVGSIQEENPWFLLAKNYLLIEENPMPWGSRGSARLQELTQLSLQCGQEPLSSAVCTGFRSGAWRRTPGSKSEGAVERNSDCYWMVMLLEKKARERGRGRKRAMICHPHWFFRGHGF